MQVDANQKCLDEEWMKLQQIKSLKPAHQTPSRLRNKFKQQLTTPRFKYSARDPPKYRSKQEEEKKESEDDDDGLASDDDFYVEPPTIGDQFMACKPWLGAIKEPDVLPLINAKAPAQSFEIDFVHGYKSDLTR